MASISPDKSTVDVLAAKLEDDMRRRGLKPGDRYLTAAEAGDMFAVSTMSADRAMQVLAKRDLLVRQRARGTFIGPKFRNAHATQCLLDVVHVMMSMDYYRSHLVSSEVFVDSLAKSCPGVAVQMHYMPDHDALPYCERIVAQTQSDESKLREAFILVRSSRQVQQYMERSGVPCVVFGNVYPGIDLPCVSYDQLEVGRLMGQYALDCGHKRFVLLMRSEWRHGDNQLLDGVNQMLAGSNVDVASLSVRSIPPDREHIVHEVEALLGDMELPVAFLCRTEFYGEIVMDVCRKAGLSNGRDFTVITGGQSDTHGRPGYATVLSGVETGRLIEQMGEMLAQIATTGKAKTNRIHVPVEMHGPGNNGSDTGATAKDG